MANHIAEYGTMRRDVKGPPGLYILTAEVNIGSTGAPTIASGNGDPDITITRTGTGAYSLTFPKSRRAVVQVIPAMATPDDVAVVVDDDLDATAGTATFVHFSAAGSAADPANGDRLFIVLYLYGSSVT